MSSSRDRTASGAASVAFIGHFSQLLKNLHFLFCASNLNCLCGLHLAALHRPNTEGSNGSTCIPASELLIRSQWGFQRCYA